jgi:hypothetical protein
VRARVGRRRARRRALPQQPQRERAEAVAAEIGGEVVQADLTVESQNEVVRDAPLARKKAEATVATARYSSRPQSPSKAETRPTERLTTLRSAV